MKEFEISDLLKLKLENNKTLIYVNNVKIIQCKYLLLNEFSFVNETAKVNSEKLSIDSQSKNLNHSLQIYRIYK